MDGLYDGRREVKTKKWSLYRLDVQNAFLHGENNKEVYFLLSQSFTIPGNTHLVCKLKKTLSKVGT